MRWLKRLLIGTISVVVILVALALAVPFLIPTDTYKSQLQERVKAATGRDLVIGGDLSFSILPSLSVSARDVTFANAPGASQKEMLKLKGLDLRLKLGPLLSGRFEVDTLVFDEPVIVLEVDKAGKPNWQFESPGATAPSPPDAPRPDASQPGPSQPSPSQPADRLAPPQNAGTPIKPHEIFETFQIVGLRIVNGNFLYADARSGARYELAKANLDIALPGGGRPFRIAGDVNYKDKRVVFRSNVEHPIALMKAEASPFDFEFVLDLATVTLKGTLQGGPSAKFEGPLDVTVASLRDLAAWAGAPLPPGKTFGPLRVAAKVSVSEAGLSLAALSFRLDDITATGELGIVAGPVPTLRGSLAIPALNLTPYMTASTAGPTAPARPGPASPGAPSPGAPSGAAPPSAGFDSALLRAVNADLKLDIHKIEAQQLRVEQAGLAIKLAGGVLAVALEQVRLYGGAVTGTVTVNGARAPLLLNPNIQLKGLDGNALLVALGAGDTLAGTLNATVNLTGTGSDAKAIQNSFAGTASFQFANGALKGYNLAGMFRAVGDIKNPLEAVQQIKRAVDALNRHDKAQRTDFSELAGSFRASNGVFNTTDLRMAAPLLRIEGRGSLSLPANAIDMGLTVRAVPTLEGQGSQFAKLGIPIPLRVRGPFANLAWGLDEKALGDELRRKLPDLLKDQILQKPGDLLKKPGGILDQFRR